MKETFKLYFKIVVWLIFIVANYFAITGAFDLLNAEKDAPVIMGVFLLAFVILSDVEVIKTYFKRRKNNDEVV